MKNYYAILGVPRHETPAGIRAAYRKLARRMHPDHAGECTTSAFQDVVEAHSVLSDADKRREYNEKLRRDEQYESRMRVQTPVHQAQPESIVEDIATRSGLLVEILLTAEEALRGGSVPVSIPVHEVCAACGGRGENWLFECFYCNGLGTSVRMESVSVPIPPSIAAGAVRTIPLLRRGIGTVYLQLRLRV